MSQRSSVDRRTSGEQGLRAPITDHRFKTGFVAMLCVLFLAAIFAPYL